MPDKQNISQDERVSIALLASVLSNYLAQYGSDPKYCDAFQRFYSDKKYAICGDDDILQIYGDLPRHYTNTEYDQYATMYRVWVTVSRCETIFEKQAFSMLSEIGGILDEPPIGVNIFEVFEKFDAIMKKCVIDIVTRDSDLYLRQQGFATIRNTVKRDITSTSKSRTNVVSLTPKNKTLS